MADIVVYNLNILKSTDPKIGDRPQRKSGMETLGFVFAEYFKKSKNPDEEAALTDDEIVNNTIREIIGMDKFIVTYLEKGNVLRVKNKKRNMYYFNPPGKPKAILTLKAVRDKVENTDGENVDVMNIALPNGHKNPLAAGNYLSNVAVDLGAADSNANRAYLLGTITFRRCR
jgi:hypothetical protein